ncbi:polysaccharide biosynthesis tyrosine autokinase, partial [bacterium]|nr:polysaccharide biosynthesis tyrosine autokinase [bacterium]
NMDNSPEGQDSFTLDFRQYLSLFWHWTWLFIIIAILAGTASYFVSSRMRPFYQSSTTMLVNEAPATKATDYTSVLMSKQLTSTYAQMIITDPILNQVIKEVGIANTIDDLKDWIDVSVIRDTQLVQVTVTTTDPDYSAKIANAMVKVFSEQIQAIQIGRFVQSKAALETQLAETDKQITLYTDMVEKATSTDEKERLDAKLTQYRSIYANLLLSYEQIRLAEAQSVSSVVQVETATPNTNPVSPKTLLNTILAALAGFILAVIIVVTKEALDDTVKTPKDIIHKFHLPVLGVINRHQTTAKMPISLTEPRSPTAEAYRALRTNVNYTSVDHPLKKILITSAEPGEGKSTTISNLAVVLAQNGSRVIIADCDMRHPRINAYFNLPNRIGMSTLFSHQEVVKSVCQATSLPGLSVITTGPLPPNPSELMGSKTMQAILTLMEQNADIILIDTPPVLAVTDAAALAPSLDGVLLVVQPGKTRMSALRQTLEQLSQVNARVLGVVLNNVVTSGKSYGYHYKEYRNYTAYQTYYGGSDKGKKKK